MLALNDGLEVQQDLEKSNILQTIMVLRVLSAESIKYKHIEIDSVSNFKVEQIIYQNFDMTKGSALHGSSYFLRLALVPFCSEKQTRKISRFDCLIMMRISIFIFQPISIEVHIFSSDILDPPTHKNSNF